MMSQPIRVGILGAGSFAARRHLPDLMGDTRVQVAAACRRDTDALAKFADHFQIAERYTDWHVMLQNAQLDGVVIATPHNQHFEQAQAALDLGLHVLLEKPMALRREDAEALALLAESRGLTLAVGMNPPYWRHAHALRDGIQSGKLGELENVVLSWSGSAEGVFGKAPLPDQSNAVVSPTLFRGDPKANGGGFLMDVGPHLLSELLWVTGLQPLEVTALMDSVSEDMRSALTIKLTGGVLATINIIGNSHAKQRRVRSEYAGSESTAVAQALPFRIQWDPEASEIVTEEQMPSVASPVADWIDCQITGRMPLGSAEHAVKVTRLLLAAYDSATTGRSVTLSAG